MQSARTKLLIAFLSAIAVFLAVEVVLFIFYARVVGQYQDVTSNVLVEYRLVEAAGELPEDYNGVLKNLNSLERRQKYTSLRDEIIATLGTLDQTIIYGDSRIAFLSVRNTMLSLISECDAGIEEVVRGDFTKMSAHYDESLRLAGFVRESSTALLLKEIEYTKSLQQDIAKSQNDVSAMAMVLFLFLAAGGVIFSVVLAHMIVWPVTRLAVVAKSLAAGSFDVKVDDWLARRDDDYGRAGRDLGVVAAERKRTVERLKETESRVETANAELKNDVRQLNELATSAAEANARLVMRTSHEESAGRIIQGLVKLPDVSAASEDALAEIWRLLGADLVQLAIFSGDEVREMAVWPPLGESERLRLTSEAGGFVAYVAKSEQPVVSDLTDEKRFSLDPSWAHLGYHRVIGVAVPGAGGNAIGLLTVCFRKSGDGDGVLVGFLKTVSGALGLALDRAREVEQGAGREAIRDWLTLAVTRDLRTPLAAVHWNLQAVMEGRAGHLEKQPLEFLRATAETMAMVYGRLDDMMTALDIAEGRLTIVAEPFRPEDVWSPVQESLKDRFEAKHIHLEYNPPPAPLATITADRTKTQAVMSKLLMNALSGSLPGGTVRVRLALEKERFRFEVSDDGVGIPRADQAGIFRLLRPGPNATHEPDAAGLELFIVKSLIERQGGSVGFRSEEARGSVFWFELPLAYDKAGEAGKSPAKTAKGEEPGATGLRDGQRTP